MPTKLALVLALSVLTQGRPGSSAPKASETARLYFLAGDLAKAQEWARSGRAKDPACGPLLKLLADYAFDVGHADGFDPPSARAFLRLDRQISPTVPGKLTRPVIDRFITHPLALAQAHQKAGSAESAARIAAQVLDVDPTNAEALALVGRDAGR
jgi:tetratricopeptide (TPR) repeat protein